MDARLQTRVQRYGWDAATAYYEDGWHAQLKPAHDVLIDAADLESGNQVIETACGSGLITRRIADKVGAGGAVLATDLSEKMVEALKHNIQIAQAPIIRAERMDAENLTVPDDTFDAGICALGLMYTPNPRKAIKELVRVIRPGGTLAATVWGERKHCGWAEVFPIVDAHVASEVCPLFFATGAPGSLVSTLESAGVREVIETRHSETLMFSNEDEVIKAVMLGGPVALAVKRFSEQTWRSVKREFLSSIANFRNSDGSYSIPGEFVTVRGVC